MKIFLKCVFIIFFVFFNVSCGVGIHHVPLNVIWTQFIDRSVDYVSEENILNHENLFEIENNLYTSLYCTYTKAPWAVIYGNYSNPYSFGINIKSLRKDIKKIKLKQCKLEFSNNENIELLNIQSENIGYAYSWRSNDGHSAHGTGIPYLKFDNDVEIIIEKREDEYMDWIVIRFDDITIDYEANNLINFYCIIEIYFDNNNFKMIEYKIEYVRRIKELKLYSFLRNINPKDTEHEITIEEWKKYM
jgi:hypothetical protein